MGYVHDTGFSQFLPPNLMIPITGTWTLAVASNVISYDRTAGDGSSTLYIPILIPSNSNSLKGAQLVSIEIMYSIAAADADDFATAALYKDTLAVDGTANSAAEVTAVTLDGDHDTAAERLAQDEHRMVITLDTPDYVDNDEGYHVELVVDCAATTELKYFGAIANYTLRA